MEILRSSSFVLIFFLCQVAFALDCNTFCRKESISQQVNGQHVTEDVSTGTYNKCMRMCRRIYPAVCQHAALQEIMRTRIDVTGLCMRGNILPACKPCVANSYYTDVESPSLYYQCNYGLLQRRRCMRGTVWHQYTRSCIYKFLAKEQGVEETSIRLPVVEPTHQVAVAFDNISKIPHLKQTNINPKTMCIFGVDNPQCRPCPKGSYYPNSESVSEFYQCSRGLLFLMECPAKTAWNKKLTKCIYGLEEATIITEPGKVIATDADEDKSSEEITKTTEVESTAATVDSHQQTAIKTVVTDAPSVEEKSAEVDIESHQQTATKTVVTDAPSVEEKSAEVDIESYQQTATKTVVTDAPSVEEKSAEVDIESYQQTATKTVVTDDSLSLPGTKKQMERETATKAEVEFTEVDIESHQQTATVVTDGEEPIVEFNQNVNSIKETTPKLISNEDEVSKAPAQQTPQNNIDATKAEVESTDADIGSHQQTATVTLVTDAEEPIVEIKLNVDSIKQTIHELISTKDNVSKAPVQEVTQSDIDAPVAATKPTVMPVSQSNLTKPVHSLMDSTKATVESTAAAIESHQQIATRRVITNNDVSTAVIKPRIVTILEDVDAELTSFCIFGYQNPRCGPCHKNMYYRKSGSVTDFYQCSYGWLFYMRCPANTVWDGNSTRCIYGAEETTVETKSNVDTIKQTTHELISIEDNMTKVPVQQVTQSNINATSVEVKSTDAHIESHQQTTTETVVTDDDDLKAPFKPVSQHSLTNQEQVNMDNERQPAASEKFVVTQDSLESVTKTQAALQNSLTQSKGTNIDNTAMSNSTSGKTGEKISEHRHKVPNVVNPPKQSISTWNKIDISRYCSAINTSPECVKCQSGIYYSNPANKSTFYQCVHGTLFQQMCAEGTIWNSNENSCVHIDMRFNSVSNQFANLKHDTKKVETNKMCIYPNLNNCVRCTTEYYKNEHHCSKYFVCINGALLNQYCPVGYHWSQQLERCELGDSC